MKSPSETLNSWNNVAEAYEKSFMKLDLYNDTYDYFLDHLWSKTSKILEIGCGPGVISSYLLRKQPLLNILGIDYASNMIALAKENVPSAHFQVMDATAISELPDSFNGIVCGFCIPYLSEKQTSTLITDSANLLPNEGVVYLSFVDGNPENSGCITGNTKDAMLFYFHTSEKIQRELKKNSFKILKKFRKKFEKPDGISEVHTIIIATKV
jgi:ubiquinone/menaquinone biosynthesis C-methylase UbiE